MRETQRVVIDEVQGSRNKNSTLTLYNVNRTDDGVYYCTAINFLFVLFQATSPVSTVVVQCKFYHFH